MSAVCECVEWGFGKISGNFAFLDFKKNLKLLLQPVGHYYLVGRLLTNVHTCLYGSQTSYTLTWIHQHWNNTLGFKIIIV
jgi:nuclease HARBI1